MSSSNLLYAIGSGAAVILIGAAVVTLRAPERSSPLVPRLAKTGDLPLSYTSALQPLVRTTRDQAVNLTRREPLDLSNFDATGFMGDGKADGEYVEVDARHMLESHSPPECLRIAYEPGPTGWAGQYWLNAPGNWGQSPGSDLRGYSRVAFWAKGERGGERLEFKAGSLDATRRPGIEHKDSFGTSLGKVSLTKDWRPYRIDLTDLDLSSVIGGFAWVATAEDNPSGAVFYIDDLRYE